MRDEPLSAEAALDKSILENQRLRLVNVSLRFALFSARQKMRFMAVRHSRQMGMTINGLYPVKRYAERFMDDIGENDIEKAAGL